MGRGGVAHLHHLHGGGRGILFPQIYGGSMWVVAIEAVLLGAYLWLALMAAREQPA